MIKFHLAPIVLFVYNRPSHTLNTLQALKKNHLADKSTLYIYADGPKINDSGENLEKIREVDRIIRSQQWCGQVEISSSTVNKGLANSITKGVNEIVNKHDAVIVLEDDLVTDKNFLQFMNAGLNKYRDDERVMQISGFSFFGSNMHSNGESYFLPITTTWGWATWKNSWSRINLDCPNYKSIENDKDIRNSFNLDGAYPYSKMLIKQMESNEISSWGIRFYWEVFTRKGLVLFPPISLITNIGWDGSGRHGDSYTLFETGDGVSIDYPELIFPNSIELDGTILLRVKKIISSRSNLLSKILLKAQSELKRIFKT